MDLIQRPELKSKYDKCKYKVKRWEHTFKKKHGRVPSKLDIREAEKEVRDAYRMYFKLKLDALDESFSGIEGFNSDDESSVAPTPVEPEPEPEPIKEVKVSNQELTKSPEKCDDEINNDKTWGTHLNNQLTKTSTNSSEKGGKNFSAKITKKLFTGSKFSKRNPRKSLSFSQKKSETFSEKGIFLSQPSTSTEVTVDEFLSLDSGTFSSESVKVVDCNEKDKIKPLSAILSIMQNSHKPLRNVDHGWLSRAAQNTGVNIENRELKQPEFTKSLSQPDLKLGEISFNSEDTLSKDDGNCSDDIIDESDSEDTCNLLHIAKKPKVSPLSERNENLSQTKVGVNNNDTDRRRTSNSQKTDLYEFKDDVKESGTTNKQNTSPVRRTSRQRKNRIVLDTNSDSEEPDPYATDHDSDDPEFDLGDKKKGQVQELIPSPPSSPVRKKSVRKKEPQEPKPKKKTKEVSKPVDAEDETYELEYAVKSRIKTAPRINIKNLVKTTQKSVETENNREEAANEPQLGGLPKSKREQMKKKLEDKVASGKLNENFVTINLKKKIYVRGKKSSNISTIKKRAWKAKKKALCGPDMDMGGCDGGQLTCYTCGQVGHFARQCKNTKGDNLLPLNAEAECPYPTLEEASQMACSSSILTIRKPIHNPKTPETEAKTPETEVRETVNEDFESNVAITDKGSLDSDDEDLLLAETVRLEEFLKIDVRHYLDSAKTVGPVYKSQENGLVETPAEVFEALHKFGHTTFRPGQEQAVMRILSGKSTLVTLSTGSGKSLCYQLPAYLYAQKEPCITLVVSPLVSLMEDQVAGIPAFLKAACLHTNQTKVQREKVLELISSGSLNVLLVSPEAVVAGERSTGFGSILRQLPPIAFACVDEAHCVSQWSHNFRPSYLMLCRVLRDRLGVNTILGLTATATRATSDSIVHHFNIPDGREGIICDQPVPENIRLTVSKDVQRDQALLGLLLSERFAECRSIIVYCTRRDECERIATYLRTCLKYQKALDTEKKKRKRVDVQAEPYHAGMAASRRRTIQRAFMSGELRIVVATVAFGMGINKSDIRAVIHYNMPMSFESYVQEIGRAGRDGLPAYCHLFLDSQGRDNNELRRHIHANSMDRHVIRKLLQKIFIPCSCSDSCTRHEAAFSIQETVLALDVPEENIATLLCYLELHENRYIEVLSPAYVTCKVISYSGPNQIRKAAMECPPLAMALALYKNEKDENVVEFPVVDVSAAMGWDSGICKHKLKNLEWMTVNGQQKRSTLSVQFSNLGFRVLAPGNLNDAALDEALDSLYQRVVAQERTALLQLQAIHATLKEAAEPTYKSCVEENETKCNDLLKGKIRGYFEALDPLEGLPDAAESEEFNEEQIVADVRALVCMYRDNVFTGRAVARIFHGIQSPNYSAVVWGRCKFWRSHINADFGRLCQVATREILKMR